MPASSLILTKRVNTINTLILVKITVTIGVAVTLSLVAGIYAGTALAFVGATAYLLVLRLIVLTWKSRKS